MTEQTKNDVAKKEGIEVDGVTFDANGQAQGLADSELNDVAGGLMAEADSGCINGANCK